MLSWTDHYGFVGGAGIAANTSIAFKLAFQRMSGVIVTDVSYLIHPQRMCWNKRIAGSCLKLAT